MSDRDLPEPLPASIASEQALLGAVLVQNDAYFRVSSFLKAEHFAEAVHQRIYAVMAEMIAANRRVTPGTIIPFLPADMAISDGMTLGQYIAHLAAEAVTILNAADYGRGIYDLAVRRTLIGLGQDLAVNAKLGDGNVSPGPLIADVAARLFEIGSDVDELDTGIRHAASYRSVVDEAEARMNAGLTSVRGARSGLVILDQKLGGFAPGDFVLIAARPSMGKSALALNLARRAALMGSGVAFHSIEMTGAQVRARLLSDVAYSAGTKVTYSAIDRKLIEPRHVQPLREAAEHLDTLPLVIIERGHNLADVAGHIRTAKRTLARQGKDLAIYVVDYLQLLKPGDRYRGDRVREVGEMSAALKIMAGKEQVAMIALCQLNRANEARLDRRPALSDLREAGNLEQDADVVIFVYREAYYLERPGHSHLSEEDKMARLVDVSNLMEAIIGKQRQGPTGTVELFADMAFNHISDWQRGPRP